MLQRDDVGFYDGVCRVCQGEMAVTWRQKKNPNAVPSGDGSYGAGGGNADDLSGFLPHYKNRTAKLHQPGDQRDAGDHDTQIAAHAERRAIYSRRRLE